MFVSRFCTHSSSHARRCISMFSADTLLSATNRAKCIDCLKKVPGLPFKTETSKAYAAVLIPVCVTRSGEVGLLYTRRSGTLSRHIRQVSFPGGIRDPTDNTYEDCALRETEEEIGLPPSRVVIWGTGELVRPPGSAAIMPVIGSIENFTIDELKINKHEVDEAFVIPIEALCSPKVRRHTQFRKARLTGYSAPVFVASPQKRIWGITGYMTNIFLNCLVPKGKFNAKVDYVQPMKHS